MGVLEKFHAYCKREGITGEQYINDIWPVWEASHKSAVAAEAAPKAKGPRFDDPPEHPVRVPGTDHIWMDLVGKEWERYYFSDETEGLNGPFLTREEAIAQLGHYCKYVLG